MKTSTKFALTAACISIFSFAGQMQSVYAKPQTPLAIMPQHHSLTKTSVLNANEVEIELSINLIRNMGQASPLKKIPPTQLWHKRWL